MNLPKILIENRYEDFVRKYSNKFNKEDLDKIVKNVQPKYYDWIGKNYDPINTTFGLSVLIPYLKKFETIHSNLPKTDINQYKNAQELIEDVKKYENRDRRKYKSVNDANIVYEDENYMVVNPTTVTASCYYGSGTKWCTAASKNTQFETYNMDGKLFYILSKKLPTSDPSYKIALLKKFDGENSFWNAVDEKINEGWIFGSDIFKSIMTKIDEYTNQEFSEQIKIFSDKEMAKKEMQRLEILRKQRILRGKLEEADERRIERVWDLDGDCDDECGKAHALLQYISENENLEIITNQDRDRMTQIKNEIENLNRTYEESEDPRVDLLNKIEELEDELENIKEKIDVYYMYPSGNYYTMTEFEVLDLDDKLYAVGTYDEINESAKRSIKDLLSDIGYEGFNRSFVESHIDEDIVKDRASDEYEYDVRENPDAFFSDDDRELSREQKGQIGEKEMRIERLKKELERLEGYKDETEDEEYLEKLEEKIEEIQDSIEELQDEIEDIKTDPEGDFREDLIEEKIDELVDDATSDPLSYINERGLDIDDFINEDDFIEAVIDSDGFVNLSRYDGSVDEYRIKDTTYYVIRLD